MIAESWHTTFCQNYKCHDHIQKTNSRGLWFQNYGMGKTRPILKLTVNEYFKLMDLRKACVIKKDFWW